MARISKAGHRYLRQMLVVGSMAVIRYAERNSARRPWLVQLLARRKAKVAAVALANKIARTVWAMMISGDRYREPLRGRVARCETRRGCSCADEVGKGELELMHKAG